MQRERNGVAAFDGCARVVRGLAAGALVVAGACSDSNSNTTPPVAMSITATSATNAQTGVVGTALAQPVGVLVEDQSGSPMANATVTWTVVSSGGTVASPTSTTDASGLATAIWTLGSTVGVDSLTASIGTGASATLTATATAGAASAMRITSGATQSVAAGSVTAPLVVQVIDQFANPIANATVSWTVSGGGALSATTSTTDATGMTQVVLTTDAAPATYLVSAASGAIAPVTFTITSM
jgi:adhesin/invasin